MRWLPLLTAAAAALLSVSSAAPVGARSSPAGTHQKVSCEVIEKYTTEWFLDNVLPEFAHEFVNNALFYSRGMSTPARELAKSQGLITIWDVWPCYLYVYHNASDNPMRCIHQDEKKRTTFYENMSRAFATKASKSAMVMHGFQDYDNPPQTGIWGRIEFPTIENVTDVDWLTKLKQDGSSLKIFWKRLRETVAQRLSWFSPPPTQPVKTDLRKRGQNACLARIKFSFFDNIDW